MLELYQKPVAWSHLARQCDGALTLVAPIVAPIAFPLQKLV